MHSNNNIHSANILLVDDNPVNLQVLGGILKKDGYQHITAISEPSQVLPLYKKHQYDLMVLDIHMPNMNGVEATKVIREFDTNTPIIALTAVEIAEIRKEVMNVGMNDIILKPYDVSQFLTTILRNVNTIQA